MIRIADLKVPTHIGVTDEERSQPQIVAVDVVMYADLSRAGISDDLADTVDYDRVASEVSDLVRSSKFRLLERLAHEIANLISKYRVVTRVTVEITKQELRLEGIDFGGVSVRIERTFS